MSGVSNSAEPNENFGPQIALAPGQRWYLAQTLPNKEASAQMRLDAQGFRNFLPRRMKTVRHARQLRRVNAPLFPRYLFVALDLDRDQWRSVNGTFGVSNLFMAEDRPLAVPIGVVETLLLSCDNPALESDLHPGQHVRLIQGPFTEALGVLDRLDARGRIEVLLNIMGGEIRIKLPRDWVQPTS